MTDKRIIRLFLDRDEECLGAVRAKYGELCLQIARGHLHDDEAAEECVNDALLDLWHNIPADRPKDLEGYIVATVRRRALCADSSDLRYSNKGKKKAGLLIFTVAAALIALCIVALPVLLSDGTTDTELPELTTEHVPEETEEVTTEPPEYDGTQGLLYEMCEDGKSARFIGFGDCREETVIIATEWGGLPVVEMLLGEIRDLKNSGESSSIGSYSKYGSEYVKHLVISDTVEIVGNEIVPSCANLESVYFGKNVHEMGTSWAFAYKSHENFVSLEVSPENETYISIGNCIIERATKKLVHGCKTSVIPDDGSVEVIGRRAFLQIKGLKSITIPESVKVIENQAFMCCRNLEGIVLPKGLQELGEGVFSSCSMLASVDLNGYTLIPKQTFYFCRRLSELKGSEDITEIGESAFEQCIKLKLTLGTSLKKIDKYAFMDLSNNITFNGTKAEWNTIEKVLFWNAYSRSGMALEWIICSDGRLSASSSSLPSTGKS